MIHDRKRDENLKPATSGCVTEDLNSSDNSNETYCCVSKTTRGGFVWRWGSSTRREGGLLLRLEVTMGVTGSPLDGSRGGYGWFRWCSSMVSMKDWRWRTGCRGGLFRVVAGVTGWGWRSWRLLVHMEMAGSRLVVAWWSSSSELLLGWMEFRSVASLVKDGRSGRLEVR